MVSEYDKQRGNRHQRGYTNKWDKARKGFLARHPWCKVCEAAGRKTEAVAVDHIEPHGGNMRLFWNRSNWQPICHACHNAKTRAEERGTHMIGCGLDGWPIDKTHKWHEKG